MEDTATAPARSETKDRVSELRNALRLFARYTRIMANDLEDGDDKTKYLLDWEMVREAVQPEKASSVFGAVLWFAFESLSASASRDDNFRVVIPEGTRRELLTFVTILFTKYRSKLLHARPQPLQSDGSMIVVQSYFNDRSEWKDVLAQLSELRGIELSVERLVLILEKYGEPSAASPDEVPADRVRHYSSILQRKRTLISKEVHEADAFNLATTELMQSGAEALAMLPTARLVTATHSVRQAGRNLTVDPIQFALEAHLRRRFPDPTRRSQILEIFNARLHTLASELEGYYCEHASDGEVLRRGDYSGIADSLTLLYDDPVIGELTSLFARASQAVVNSRVQATEIAPDLDVLDGFGEHSFASLKRKVQLALGAAGIAAVTAKDLALRWRFDWEAEGTTQFTLLDRHESPVLQAQTSKGRVTLAWRTHQTFVGFCECLSRVHIAHMPRVEYKIAMFVGDIHDPIQLLLSDLNSMIPALREQSRDRRVELVRIDVGGYEVWYDLGAGEGSLAGSSLEFPFVAIRLASASEFGSVIDLFEETVTPWTFTSAISECILALEKK